VPVAAKPETVKPAPEMKNKAVPKRFILAISKKGRMVMFSNISIRNMITGTRHHELIRRRNSDGNNEK